MIISPVKAIENSWVKDYTVTKDMIQPNGLDFTLDKLYRVTKDSSPFILTENYKSHRSYEEVHPYETLLGNSAEKQKVFKLEENKSYDFQSKMTIALPRDVTALIIVRSTLNRNQIFISSGVYDSGFNGNVGGQLHNRGDVAIIGVGTRIGQIIFMDAQSAKVYNGSYQNLSSDHWSK